jgi:hypothetical protein
MRSARGAAAQPAELTAELLRECRGAASAAAAELQSRERELAALSARWPQPWSKLLAPGSGGRERAADAQAAAELRGAQPPSADPPSKADGLLLEDVRLLSRLRLLLPAALLTAVRAALPRRRSRSCSCVKACWCGCRRRSARTRPARQLVQTRRRWTKAATRPTRHA